MQKDYYSILGVGKNATDDELKSAYRSLSKRYHPDLQQGKSESEKKEAEEKFKEINEAYSILGDKDKRKNYDNFGTADFNGGGFGSGGFDPMSFFRSHFGADFGNFGFGFGHGGGMHRKQDNPNAPKDGRDVEISLEISFEEALYGVNREFDIKFGDTCDHCNGTGSEDGKLDDCPTCGGSGMVSHRIAANFFQSTTCPKCHGSGSFAKTPCHKCNGSKICSTNHHINMRIPAGVDRGEILRVPHEGCRGINGGNNGDLYISLRVRDSKLFARSGEHLATTVYVPSVSIGIVDTVDVPTPWGTKKIKIPNTQSKNGVYEVKISGYGIRSKERGQDVAGDLFVSIVPETIVNTTPEQKSLIEKLVKTITDNNLKLSSNHKKIVDEFNTNASKFKK